MPPSPSPPPSPSSSSPPPGPLAQLPAEVLVRIVFLLHPATLPTQHPAPAAGAGQLDLSPATAPAAVAAVLQARRDLCNAARTCRTLLSAARRVLYGSVTITSGRCARLLARTLRQDAQRRGALAVQQHDYPQTLPHLASLQDVPLVAFGRPLAQLIEALCITHIDGLLAPNDTRQDNLRWPDSLRTVFDLCDRIRNVSVIARPPDGHLLDQLLHPSTSARLQRLAIHSLSASAPRHTNAPSPALLCNLTHLSLGYFQPTIELLSALVDPETGYSKLEALRLSRVPFDAMLRFNTSTVSRLEDTIRTSLLMTGGSMPPDDYLGHAVDALSLGQQLRVERGHGGLAGTNARWAGPRSVLHPSTPLVSLEGLLSEVGDGRAGKFGLMLFLILNNLHRWPRLRLVEIELAELAALDPPAPPEIGRIWDPVEQQQRSWRQEAWSTVGANALSASEYARAQGDKVARRLAKRASTHAQPSLLPEMASISAPVEIRIVAPRPGGWTRQEVEMDWRRQVDCQSGRAPVIAADGRAVTGDLRWMPPWVHRWQPDDSELSSWSDPDVFVLAVQRSGLACDEAHGANSNSTSREWYWNGRLPDCTLPNSKSVPQE